jgi:hypothetical protein
MLWSPSGKEELMLSYPPEFEFSYPNFDDVAPFLLIKRHGLSPSVVFFVLGHLASCLCVSSFLCGSENNGWILGCIQVKPDKQHWRHREEITMGNLVLGRRTRIQLLTILYLSDMSDG